MGQNYYCQLFLHSFEDEVYKIYLKHSIFTFKKGIHIADCLQDTKPTFLIGSIE